MGTCISSSFFCGTCFCRILFFFPPFRFRFFPTTSSFFPAFEKGKFFFSPVRLTLGMRTYSDGRKKREKCVPPSFSLLIRLKTTLCLFWGEKFFRPCGKRDCAKEEEEEEKEARMAWANMVREICKPPPGIP